MTPDDRYDVSGLPEAQFEPGSNGQVIKNRLGSLAAAVLPERHHCSKNAYIAAIRAGLDKHYAPMETSLGEIIEQSHSSS